MKKEEVKTEFFNRNKIRKINWMHYQETKEQKFLCMAKPQKVYKSLWTTAASGSVQLVSVWKNFNKVVAKNSSTG